MPINPSPAIPIGAVLGAMREALGSLRNRNQIPYGDIMTETMKALAHLGHTVEAGEDFRGAWQRLGDRHPLTFTLIEAHHQLLTLGYIVPWPSTPNSPSFNWLHITEKGQKWIESSESVPEDSDRFISTLNTLIPTLDPVIKQYLIEAVVTYNRQAWFASAVMVGAASEKAVYMLIESLLAVTETPSDRMAIEKAINERSLPKMFGQINKALTKHRESRRLPYTVCEGSEHHILSLFDSIRVQRNDAVHPTIGTVTPESVRLTLSAFPSACRKVYDLINWCQAGAEAP